MLTLFTVSMALAFSAPDADIKDKTQLQPAQAEQTVDMSKRLSSAELTRLIPGQLPEYCEAYSGLEPVTGDMQCDYVICRPPGGVWSIHDCWEFGL